MSPSSQFQVTVATNNYKHACDKSVILSQKKELTLKNKQVSIKNEIHTFNEFWKIELVKTR